MCWEPQGGAWRREERLEREIEPAMDGAGVVACVHRGELLPWVCAVRKVGCCGCGLGAPWCLPWGWESKGAEVVGSHVGWSTPWKWRPHERG